MTRLIDYFNSLNKILDDEKRKKLLKKYNDWVKYQDSIIDDNPNVSRPHHVLTCNNHGTSIKPHDLWQVPLTNDQHIRIHSSKYFRETQRIVLDKLPELHERFVEECCIELI